MEVISVKKGELLQKSGDVHSKIYRVQSGLLRSYSLDQKGKEHIFLFAPENWVIADNLPDGQPCDLYIDALEDSVVQVIPKDISKEGPNVPAFVKRMAVLQKRVLMLMSASAIERYEHFEETYPDILQRVTQKMIASYLGITPEALSKVKTARKHKQ